MKPLLLPSTEIQSKGCTPKRQNGRFLGYSAKRLQRKPLNKCYNATVCAHCNIQHYIGLFTFERTIPFYSSFRRKLNSNNHSLPVCLLACMNAQLSLSSVGHDTFLLPSTIFNRRVVPQNGKFLGSPAERLHKSHNKCYDDATLSTTPLS
jgi:hypothetical protein